MHSIEALHHAARQYCIERAAVWRERYARLNDLGRATVPIAGGNWRYTREAYDVFPRYLVLAAIQHEVERFLPDSFSSLDEERGLLALAGETAQSQLTKHENPTAIAADLDERRQFADFIRTIHESRLSKQKAVPFRRVLETTEHNALHNAVAEKWGKWYGGSSDRTSSNSDVVTLHDAVMEHPNSYALLREALHKRGVANVFELREHGDGYEMAVESTGFMYDGAEGFWTSHDLGWLVYASHESSITFGSRWLIDTMCSALPAFEKYIYKGWDRRDYE